MMEFKLKKGFTIRIAGEAEKVIEDAPSPERIALKPTDFRGITPRLNVNAGDIVKKGTPLFHDKYNEKLIITSPVSGRVMDIIRGERRILEAIIINCDGKKNEEDLKVSSSKLNSSRREEIIGLLLKTGLFPHIKQRPFARTANPERMPRDIFISAMDTAPLAPDPNLIVLNNEDYFQKGIDILSKLTDGRVRLSMDGSRGDNSRAFTEARNAEIYSFTGPHPAGNPGVQIHHIAPVTGAKDIVWHLSVQGTILIGKFFATGKIPVEITAALAGTSAPQRKYYRTVIGTSIDSLLGVEAHIDDVRYISGNVLTGDNANTCRYLGFYHNLVTIIPEVKKKEFLGWFMPGLNRESFSPSFLSRYIPGLKLTITTAQNGSRRAFVATGKYEKVLPMDIYPMFLVKSILAEDIEEMEKLGIFEVAEEDMALCEYICPSKVPIQEIIRQGIELMEKEG